MTVIVWDSIHTEDRQIIGVFDTQEKADKFIEDNNLQESILIPGKRKYTGDNWVKIAIKRGKKNQ